MFRFINGAFILSIMDFINFIILSSGSSFSNTFVISSLIVFGSVKKIDEQI
jgi:hypothetical protein